MVDITLHHQLLEQSSTDTGALFELGLLYFDEKNYPEAEKYFRQAFERKHADSATYIGLIYYVQHRFGEASSFFREGSRRHDTRAMVALGVMYETGCYFLQSDAEALYWYARAAQHNNAVGIHRHTCLQKKMSGEPVPQLSLISSSERIVKRKPKDPFTPLPRGWAIYSNKNHQPQAQPT